jgi:exopolysaccharide biosynthesis protein
MLLGGSPGRAQSTRPTLSASPQSRQLVDGIVYTYSTLNKNRWHVHTVVVDVTRPAVDVRLAKGLDHISGLERVHSIMHRADSIGRYAKVYAGVNANFWQAGSNHPIGPTVIDGIILNNRKFKNWSSLAKTRDGRYHMNNFEIRADVVTRYGRFAITRFNERADSTSVSLYTPYAGSSVPAINDSYIFQASADTVTDESEAENTVAAAVDSVWSVSLESGTLKAQFEYLSPPAANTTVLCRITHVDTGFVMIPKNGGVLSFGKGQYPVFFSVLIGDTFSIASRLFPEIEGTVVEMSSGTPRLVRDGKITVEWQQEGLRKPRFVTGSFGRTAIGLSADGKKIILVTVEPPNRRQGRRGIPLQDLAAIMVENGAYQAMNYDGGSSATMVIEDTTVSPPGGNRTSRKISTALMIVKTK